MVSPNAERRKEFSAVASCLLLAVQQHLPLSDPAGLPRGEMPRFPDRGIRPGQGRSKRRMRIASERSPPPPYNKEQKSRLVARL